MTCRKSFELDLAAFLANPRDAEWDEFRAHYPQCVDCAAEVAAWTALGAQLGPEHPAPETLLRFADDPSSMAAEERDATARHVARCAACADELRALGGFAAARADDAKVPRDRSGFQRPASATTRETAQRSRLRTVGRALWNPALPYAALLALVLLPRLWPTIEEHAPKGADTAPVASAPQQPAAGLARPSVSPVDLETAGSAPGRSLGLEDSDASARRSSETTAFSQRQGDLDEERPAENGAPPPPARALAPEPPAAPRARAEAESEPQQRAAAARRDGPDTGVEQPREPTAPPILGRAAAPSEGTDSPEHRRDGGASEAPPARAKTREEDLALRKEAAPPAAEIEPRARMLEDDASRAGSGPAEALAPPSTDEDSPHRSPPDAASSSLGPGGAAGSPAFAALSRPDTERRSAARGAGALGAEAAPEALGVRWDAAARVLSLAVPEAARRAGPLEIRVRDPEGDRKFQARAALAPGQAELRLTLPEGWARAPRVAVELRAVGAGVLASGTASTR